MITTLFSLVPPSTLKVIGGNLLLVGLIGDIAILLIAVLVKQERKRLEKALGIIFSILLVGGVWLENIADEPRSLNSVAQHRLAEQLKQFAGTPFDFSVNLDPEAVALMDSIDDALTKAGWKRQAYTGGMYHPPQNGPAVGVVVFKGLEVQITKSRQSEWGAVGQPATVLWHALQGEGITASALVIRNNEETSNAVHIKIGSKP